MALTATLYRFVLEISDIDRGVYETIEERVACHPSEDHERLVVRVLARAIAHEEGLDFGRGLSTPDDAALWTHSPVGEIERWIEVGAPTAERLHRSSKRCATLQVFTNKTPIPLQREWSSRAVHRSESVEIVQLPTDVVAKLAADLGRAAHWYITIHEGQLSVSDGAEMNLAGPIVRRSLDDFLAFDFTNER